MIKFSVTLPAWTHWLIPQWLRSDLEQRSALNGSASRSFGNRNASVTIKADVQD